VKTALLPCVVAGYALGKAEKGRSIPTVGIGASANCDGQILVFEDMVGLMQRVPTFVKRYGTMEEMMRDAVGRYAQGGRRSNFPTPEHTNKKK
jgi:3-methyl-2-oxobutanoate hydroxymethyltransferase